MSVPAPAAQSTVTPADVDLPKASIRKLAKARLAFLAPPAADGGPGKEAGLAKDALDALAESTKVSVDCRGGGGGRAGGRRRRPAPRRFQCRRARLPPPQVFVSFITATANDICRETKRQVCGREVERGGAEERADALRPTDSPLPPLL